MTASFGILVIRSSLVDWWSMKKECRHARHSMSIQKTQNLMLISNRGNNLKKVNPEKVIFQKLLQVSSIEEDKLQFCTLLLPITFLIANFLSFSQRFRNQRKILSWFDTHIKILLRKSL
jgi:hypothetical protein